MKLNASTEAPEPPQTTAPLRLDDERSLDGDFDIEGDSGTVDGGGQAHVPPPPPPAC